MKSVIAISCITLGIICGAITGIVGGAFGMAATAAALHIVVDNGQ